MRTFSPRYPRKYPIVALLLFAAGCFQGEAPETPVRPEKPGARRKAPDCPKGTTPDHFEGENSVSYECVLPNGKRHGPFVRYHANGKKAHEGAWRDGVPDGRWEGWDENGSSLGSFVIKDGTGVWIDWYPNGKKRAERNYLKGKLEGEGFAWYENGQLEIKGAYLEGMQHGLWVWFYEDGQKQAEVEYLYGRNHGTARFWNKDGTLLREEEHRHGHKLSETLYEGGKIIATNKFPLEEPQGNRIISRGHPAIDPAWQACSEHTECQAIPTTCCACGAGDMVAVHYRYTRAAQEKLVPPGSCDEVECPSMMCLKMYTRCEEGACVTSE